MNTQSTVKAEVLPEEREDRVGWAYQVAQETAKAEARFDAWAEDYDQDVEDLLGWKGPQATLDYVLKYTKPSDYLLDAGSGTGLMGELLKEAGYKRLVGTDISVKMLEVARTKSIYTDDFQADLTERLPLNDEIFDSVVSVGVSGYMIASTISDFNRIIRPGGYIIYTISDFHYEAHGFKTVVDDLVASDQLVIEEIGEEFAAIPKSEPDHKARVHVYRKL